MRSLCFDFSLFAMAVVTAVRVLGTTCHSRYPPTGPRLFEGSATRDRIGERGMPRSESPSPYRHYRTEVEGMLAGGRPLGAVERMLERAPLEADQRSALWLLAWATHDHLGELESVVLAPPHPDPPQQTELR